MIEYRYPEEKIVAQYFAEVLQDTKAGEIIQRGTVTSAEEATHLSQFFWAMIEKSTQAVEIPCEGSAEYWTEKLYNTLGGYLENAGYGQQWEEEIDKA